MTDYTPDPTGWDSSGDHLDTPGTGWCGTGVTKAEYAAFCAAPETDELPDVVYGPGSVLTLPEGVDVRRFAGIIAAADVVVIGTRVLKARPPRGGVTREH